MSESARKNPVSDDSAGSQERQPEIWMINHYAITPDLPGGTRHFDLAAELSQRGYRVKVFASDVNLSLRKHTRLQPGELYTIEKRDGVEFIWVQAAIYESNNWRRTWNMLSFSVNFLRTALDLTKEKEAPPQVIIGSSPHLFAALAAEFAARWFRARFVLELRDLWPQALVDMGGLLETAPTVRLLRALERYLYRRAEKIIILARGSGEYLAERGTAPSRILFLPNGVHLGHFKSRLPREKAREKYGFEAFTVVYTGAHGPANSLETVVHAALRLRDLPVEFVLIGDGPSKPELSELVKREQAPNIRLLPPVPKDEIPDVLSAADACVITLKNVKAFSYGVSPNKLFDYMAASRPVICGVPGEMGAMVEEARAGYRCQAEDADALAGAVRRLMADTPAEREEMGRSGREWIQDRFRREVLVDGLTAMLDSLLRPHSRTAG